MMFGLCCTAAFAVNAATITSTVAIQNPFILKPIINRRLLHAVDMNFVFKWSTRYLACEHSM